MARLAQVLGSHRSDAHYHLPGPTTRAIPAPGTESSARSGTAIDACQPTTANADSPASGTLFLGELQSPADHLGRVQADDRSGRLAVLSDGIGQRLGLTADQDASRVPWRQHVITPAVERHAGHLARTHALRGADAVHLASALAIGDPDLVVAVWDRRRHAGTRTAGLRAAPARLDA